MRGLYVVLTHPVDGRDPLRLLSPGGGVHSEGLLPGVNHPAVLSLPLALLQQPHTHLLQGDDVLGSILDILHQDTPVDLHTTTNTSQHSWGVGRSSYQNIIEQEKLSGFHSRPAGLGEDSLCYEDSSLDCQGLTGDSKTSINLQDPLTHFRLLSHAASLSLVT